MQGYKKLSARILSVALSIAMVTTMMTATVFSAEDGSGTSGASSIGEITSFDKLEDRFTPSVGENAPDHMYDLPVALGTPAADLQLPAELTAMVERAAVQDSGTTAAKETIPVTWTSDKEYVSDENGTFIYTAVLPEGYILADGAKLPQIYVAVGGKQARAGSAITVLINDTTTKEGATLTAALQGQTNVTTLKITAGAVTEDDWNYLKSLSAMTSFEIAAAVTVGGIPDGTTAAPIFPASIVTVKVPQAIAIGTYAFYKCAALTSASFPEATSIGTSAFDDCTALTTANFPAATSIGGYAFFNCAPLTSASFPAAIEIGRYVFSGCTALVTLNLGATPPQTVVANAFKDCPATRALGYVKADGTPITGADLTTVQAEYKAKDDGGVGDGLWYGWTIEPAATGITVTINGTEYKGSTLAEAIETVPGGAPAVTSLKITAGAVTEADWNYLGSLTSMTTFEIDAAVTVGDIPDGTTAAPIFPASIVTVKVPQAIAIGVNAFKNCSQLTSVTIPAAKSIRENAFSRCSALTSVSFPEATSIGTNAFEDCTALTTANSPAATSIGNQAFQDCAALASTSFPVAASIGGSAFYNCTALVTLNLGAAPPETVGFNAFRNCPTPRALGYVAANGTALTGEALTNAQAAYKAKDDGDTNDGKWYGWTIVPTVSYTVTINGGGSGAGNYAPGTTVSIDAGSKSGYTFNGWTASPAVSFASASSAITTFVMPSSNVTVTSGWTSTGGGGGGTGGSGGGSSGGGEKKDPLLNKGSSDGLSATKDASGSKNSVISAATGSKAATDAVASAVKNATQSGAAAKATFNNFSALDVAGLKAINDVAAKESAGKTIDFKVNFDTVVKGVVTSRVSVDPAALATVMTEQLPLGVYFNQQNDKQVTSVNKTFDKFFTNKVVTVSYDQKSPLAVNAEFAAKLDLSGLNEKSLYIYSYNRETKIYTRIDNPNYWADSNGYSHITAPLGGSIIISDSPLTKK